MNGKAQMLKPASLIPLTLAGILVGAACSVSPLSVALSIGLIGLFVWAGRDVPAVERRWLWGMLAVAIAARLLVILGLYLWSHGDAFATFPWEPDSGFQKMRSLWIRNLWLGVPMPAEYAARAFGEPEAWTSYLYLIAALQTVFGPSQYAIHYFNVVLFMVSAVALYRLVRTPFGGEVALGGLFLMLFYPSLFLWSVTALKESCYLLLGVLSLVGLVVALRPGAVGRRVGAVLLIVACVALIGTVRTGGDLITAGAVTLGAAAVFLVRRPVWIVLPIAALALFCTVALVTPKVREQTRLALATAARMHIGHVRTEGFVYKLLDPRFYDVVPVSTTYRTMTASEATRFVIRALVSVVVVPAPWQPHTTYQLAYIPLQMGWYAIALLAAIGVVAGLRRDVVLTCVLAGFVVAGLGAVALVSGNIGTLVRHRDSYVPFLVWFSSLGAMWSLAKVASLMPSAATMDESHAGA